MDQENIDKNEIYLYYFIENVVKLRKHFHLSKAQMAGIMGIGIQSIRSLIFTKMKMRLLSRENTVCKIFNRIY